MKMNRIGFVLFVVIIGTVSANCGSSAINDIQELVHDFFNVGRSGVDRTFNSLRETFDSIRTSENVKNKVYRVEAAIPGYDKGSIKIKLERASGGAVLLTISAGTEKKESSETTEKHSYSKSAFFAKESYKTAITLPSYININSAKSSYDNGILIINLKFDESKKDVVEVSIED